MKKLTKKLIEKRINNFLGYGNLSSNIWFIGMEEGLGKDEGVDDLIKRFKTSGDKSVLDIQDDMKNVPKPMEWFKPGSKMQKTWGKLILILLTLESNKEITNERIKEFQKNKFARLNSNHCNFELMPLPCHSTKKEDWKIYNEIYCEYKINYLESRKKYFDKIMDKRIVKFKDLIKGYSPKIVICYSFSYLKYWKDIIDCNLNSKINQVNLYHCHSGKTDFFVMPHPNYRISNHKWKTIAKKIKEVSEKQS